jgi:MFS family permease
LGQEYAIIFDSIVINDINFCQVIIIPATLLFSLATLLTSLCKRYYEFILCQGVFGGLTMGLCYSPAIAVVGHYFHRKRPLVMGICASGSALAGIILPIILDQLFNHTTLGFGWSQRIIGFIFLGFSLVACVTIYPGVEPRKGKYLLPEAFKKPAYSFQVIGLFLIFWGLFEPFFYLPTYAEQHGTSVSLSFHLITILNAGSFIGRIAAGGLGLKIGQFNVLSFSSMVCAVLILSWIRITSSAGLIVFAVLYGFFSGAVISTMISTIPQIASHPSQIGTYIGMMSGIVSVAALIGAPITGAMISRYHDYKQATIFSGVIALVGSCFTLAARFAYGKTSLLV